jgi:nucleotide-binding universal stress UspA family protein
MTIPKVEVKNILYATDLSDNARYAFAYAVSLANLYGAKITFFHALPDVPPLLDATVVGYVSTEKWEEIKQQHYQEAQKSLTGKRSDRHAIQEVLNQFSANAKQGQEGSSFEADDIIVNRGNPVELILAIADEKNCDLIVMGTHGHGRLADAMMGSTARRVLRRSRKPVLVVRLPEQES